jgi:hypothetical protein
MARHMTVHKSAGDGMVHKDKLKRMCRKNCCAPIGLIHRTILPASALCGIILLKIASWLAWQQFRSRPGSTLLRRIIGVTGFSPAAVNRGGK